MIGALVEPTSNLFASGRAFVPGLLEQLNEFEQQSKELSTAQKNLELNDTEKNQRIKDLEKSHRYMKQEKEELARVNIRFPCGVVLLFLLFLLLLLLKLD